MNQQNQNQVMAEAIIMPDLPIIDSHIHLWLRDNYFAPDMLADAQVGHDVRASIYVECSMAFSDDPRPGYDAIGETSFVLEQIQQAEGSNHALAAGILGMAELTMGDNVRGVLDAHIEAGQGHFRGVRYRVAWDADPIAGYGEIGYQDVNVLTLPEFHDGAQCLVDLGLVLDMWGFHPQLQDIARFAEKLPALPIVINHVGGPLGVGSYANKRKEVFAVWHEGIKALAELPNVHIKLSGLAISRIGFGFQENGPVSSDELVEQWSPYIETCVKEFGPNRAIFGSNYPVDRAAAPYGILLNAYKKMLADLPREQLEAIFAGNARRVYSID